MAGCNHRAKAHQQVPAMAPIRDIELAVGRALVNAYPWMLKVQHPPGCGLIDFAAIRIYSPAVNDARFEADPPDKLKP